MMKVYICRWIHFNKFIFVVFYDDYSELISFS